MTFIEEKIRQTLQNLQDRIVTEQTDIPSFSVARCPYKTENRPADDLSWETFSRGDYLKLGGDAHAWLTFEADVPKPGDDERIVLSFTTGITGWDACNPQGMLFLDGDTTCAQAFDVNHTSYEFQSFGHKTIAVYFYAGAEAGSFPLAFSLRRENTSVTKLWYDLYVPFDALQNLKPDSFAYTRILNALDTATLALDFRGGRDAAFYESVKKADDFLQTEFYGKLCGKDALGEISFIGHTHIDVAWLWTLAQTAEKAQRSFATETRLLEKFPDYVFMSSQPQLYAYVKQNDPVLFEKIKQFVREGRWEPEGAMWLESDTNLVSGESLVRQILYGKKFMKEEFGADNHILWLPDVFGYSAALPQILKKCGVDTFFTTKISWCETDKFPHDTFTWQGLDGSEVFAVLSNCYVNRLEPRLLNTFLDWHVDKKYTDTSLVTFGFGDGGGGPTERMVENFGRLKAGLPGLPKISMVPVDKALASIRRQFDESVEKLRFEPKWSGELYLEMHRGTYTTQANNKKNNRRAEFLYQNAEAACLTASLLAAFPYPAEKLEQNWHTLLKNQFHDIIPGSSIKEVYQVSSAEYAALTADGNGMIDGALDAIAPRIRSRGGLLVYNPLSFPFSGVIKTPDGKAVVSDIPAHGYAVAKPQQPENTVTVSDRVLENEFLRVTFDEHYHIISLYDKENRREVIQSGQSANVFTVYEDYPREYDAWEITEYYKQKKWIADDVSAVSTERDALSAGIRIERHYANSVFTQVIRLTTGSRRLDFETTLDWHEEHVLLKTVFPFAVRSEEASYEIQYGHIRRPTHRNTSWDQARFEVCAHKWADLSEDDYGVALLNDCKYGYSTEENVMTLSLLKAPTYPDPTADRGVTTCTYSLLPHAGDLARSEVVCEGYRLNNPPIARPLAASETGDLPGRFSLVSVDSDSVMIDTVKRAEDGNGFVVRLYEAHNRHETVTLTFGVPVTRVSVTDMLENGGEALPVANGAVSLGIAPFEVVTLRVIPA